MPWFCRVAQFHNQCLRVLDWLVLATMHPSTGPRVICHPSDRDADGEHQVICPTTSHLLPRSSSPSQLNRRPVVSPPTPARPGLACSCLCSLGGGCLNMPSASPTESPEVPGGLPSSGLCSQNAQPTFMQIDSLHSSVDCVRSARNQKPNQVRLPRFLKERRGFSRRCARGIP